MVKMKSKLFILCVLVLAMAIVISGCGSQTAETPSTQTDGNSSASNGTAQEADKPIKAVLLVRTNLGDKSFYDSAWAGLKKAEAELGIEVKAIEIGGDQSKYEPTFIDASESDADIIILDSSQLREIAEKYVDQYPEKKYIIFDNEPTYKNTHSNVYAISFKPNESSFLAGVVGAKMSKTKVLGFVGGIEVEGINDFLVGYISGAKYADPNIKMNISYVGNFTDAAKGKELALIQINNKTDVIHAVAGGAGLGVLDAAKEKGIWALGVDTDQAMMLKDSSPETADRILTSALKNVDIALYRALDLYKNNQIKWGTLDRIGIKEGVGGIAKNEFYEKNVSADIRKYVDEIEQKIISGEIVVPTAYGMDNQTFQDLKNSVKP